jgi:hypothetical protein
MASGEKLPVAKTGGREIREHGCAPRRVAVSISKPFLKGNAFYGFIQRVKVNVSQQWGDDSSLWCPTPLPHVNSGIAPVCKFAYRVESMGSVRIAVTLKRTIRELIRMALR